jgi:hypothetical protein
LIVYFAICSKMGRPGAFSFNMPNYKSILREIRVKRLTAFAALLFNASIAFAADKATAKAESVLYSQPAASSATHATLATGTAVEVVMEMRTAEGAWCQVRSSPEKKNLGYVRCSALARERKQLPEVADFENAANSFTGGDEITSLRCEDVSFEAWMQRYQYTPEQLDHVNAFMESTGFAECQRRAAGFKQAYRPNMPMDQKLQLVREWVKQDPNESCAISYVRMWRGAGALMNNEQLSRLRDDYPKVAAIAKQMRANPEKGIPAFCLF